MENHSENFYHYYRNTCMDSFAIYQLESQEDADMEGIDFRTPYLMDTELLYRIPNPCPIIPFSQLSLDSNYYLFDGTDHRK